MGEGVVVRPDQVLLGVLVAAVPRDAVDGAVAALGVGAKRSDGKLPPHVAAYLVMALCLFGEDDYTEVATKVTGSLLWWGCWDTSSKRPRPLTSIPIGFPSPQVLRLARRTVRRKRSCPRVVKRARAPHSAGFGWGGVARGWQPRAKRANPG